MMADRLVGTWRLKSYEVKDQNGESVRPFGDEPKGFLTYTPDGFMSGQLGRADREAIASVDWETAPDAEIAAAARDYFAYCGTYELHGDTVSHRVELSLLPNWIGGEQRRLVSLHGDHLTLSASFDSADGSRRTAVLTWHRLGPAT